MPSQNTPSLRESVFVQRNDANTFYEQVNISGSDLIFYHSSSGELTADRISVWAAKYGIGTGGVTPGGSYNISASYASASLSASYAAIASNSISASWASQSLAASSAISASWASSSISSSYLKGSGEISSSIDFQITTDPTYKEGRVFYDSNSRCLACYGMNNTTLQLGQEMVIRVHNKTGVKIDNGKLVSDAGTTTGFRPDIQLAVSNGDNEIPVLGMTTEDIPNNRDGYVTCFGLVHDLNTSGLGEGTPLFLSSTTSGSWTTVHPSYPHNVLRIGTVLRDHPTLGIVAIDVECHTADWAFTSSYSVSSSYAPIPSNLDISSLTASGARIGNWVISGTKINNYISGDSTIDAGFYPLYLSASIIDVKTNTIITGSLGVTGNITAPNFIGTASYAISASYAPSSPSVSSSYSDYAVTSSNLISYNTYTDDSNYERMVMNFSSNTASIALQNAGTGLATRPFELLVNNTSSVRIGTTIGMSLIAPAPIQSTSTTVGSNVVINSSNAVAGSSVDSAAAGGNITLRAGNAAARGDTTAAGGAVTITGGTGVGTVLNDIGGAISILGGSGGWNGIGGAVSVTGGTGTGGSAGGALSLSGGTGAGTGGNVSLAAGASTGGNIGSLTVSTPNTYTTSATVGDLTIRAGALNYGINSTINAGAIKILTQKGANFNPNAGGIAGNGGLISITLGNGGTALTTDTRLTGSGGAAGAFSILGGTGGSATGAGNVLKMAGNGSAFTFTSGNGGSARSGSINTGSYGGNSGNIILQTGLPGTGSTANGTAGTITLGIANTSSLFIDSNKTTNVNFNLIVTGSVTASNATFTNALIIPTTSSYDFTGSASTTGSLIYNTDNNFLYICVGTTWRSSSFA